MADILPFPVSSSCSGRTMPALTTPEHRERARDAFYSLERSRDVDPFTAYFRAEAFLRDMERIAKIMERS